MPIPIAVNARFQQRRITGVDRYAWEVSRRLTNPIRFLKPKTSLPQFGGHLWEQSILPMQIRRGELLWSPANSGPWTVRDQVVTIHDASVFDHPEWFRPSFAAWTRLSWKILAKQIRAIITVSEFSRHRLSLHLNIPPQNIHAIHNGVGKPFEPQPATQIEAIKEKYNLKKPYFLFVGTNEPRKNIGTLLNAWKLLDVKTHELFLAGKSGGVFKNADRQASLIDVPDADLPPLYAGATAFVLPSLYEGFGLSILEAMACGTPVIAAKIGAFMEIFDNAALFVDPANPQEIAEAMKVLIEDRQATLALMEHGHKRSQELSWDMSAAKTQAILENS